MNRQEILKKTYEIIAEQLGLVLKGNDGVLVPYYRDDPVTEKHSFKLELGADSLDMVEIAMELEDAFDLHISDNDIESLQTVGDMVKYVEENI